MIKRRLRSPWRKWKRLWHIPNIRFFVAFDLFKVADTVNNIELYKKLSELQTAVYTLEEENRSLKEQLRERDTRQNIAIK